MGNRVIKWIVLLVCTVIYISSSCNCLYEDQVGKFDWHQKYFGHINYIVSDLKQPKRIVVGARNNVVGAVNSNTGSILYRQVLESNGELKYLGNYGDSLFIAVSSLPDLVKIRTFEAATGILVEERAFTATITHVGESKSNIFLIDASSKHPEITVSSVNLEEDEKDGFKSSRSIKLESKEPAICQVSSEFLICSQKNIITVINLENGSVSRKTLEDGFEVSEISTSGSGKIPAVLLTGKKGVQIFYILKNDKNGPELLPIPYSTPSGVVRLSQGFLEDEPVLFIASIKDPREILVEVYNKNLEKQPSQELQVQCSIPITSLRATKGFCSGARCGFIGFTKEELLFGTKVDAKAPQKTQLNVDWTRHEALGSVLAAEVVDYPSDLGPSWNPYHSQQDVITAFISRVKYEIETVVLGESLYSSSLDRFGLRKIIVLVTSVGQVVGMDSVSGSILYSFVLPDFELLGGSNALLYIQRPAKFAPLKPQATVIYSSAAAKSGTTILYPFNPVDGKPLDQPQTYPPILQAQIMLHGTEETKFLKPLLLMDTSHVIHSYPATVPKITNSYFFIAKKNPPLLQGYGIRPIVGTTKLQGKLLWELNLGDGDILGVHGKLLGERVHSQGRVLPDRSVSYKYMNPNLVAVVTGENEAGNINVFLVDAVSGNVVHSFWHKKSRGPVHVVHSEHWIVYSLYSEKSRRYEVNSVELYEGQSQSNATAFSSFSSTLQPIVVKQSYVFPTGIQYMAHTRTEKGITNKDVLVALPSGGVVELPRMILQPRLTQQHYLQQVQHDEDGVILSMPYIPELPIPDEMIINYNQSVKRVSGIKTWPTRLESTCLVLVHGLDLFYTRVTPSKTFDVLKDDFDNWFIAVVLAALVAGAYVTKRLAARKQLEQAWR